MLRKLILTVPLLLITLTFLSGNVYSQKNDWDKKTPEEIATKITERMKKNLSLTDDQYKQVYSLALAKANDRINNREYFKNLDKESRRQLKKQSRDEFKKQLQGILNPEQLQKMEQNINKHKKNKGNKNKQKE